MHRERPAPIALSIDRRIAQWLRVLTIAFPLMALCVVALAISSQLVRLPLFPKASYAFQGMAMLTALGIICISAAQFGQRSGMQIAVKLGSTMGLTFSIIVLASYALDARDMVSPKIAEGLFGESALSGNQCSIATAVCLVLLSVSQYCRVVNRDQACDYLAGTTVLIAGAAIIATLFRVQDLHHIFIYSSMSIPTALALWLLGIASLATDPTKGWAALIASGRPAGRTTRRHLVLSHGPILLVGIAIQHIRNGRITTEAALTFLVIIVMAPTILLIFKNARAQEGRDKTNEAVERFRQETVSGVQTKLFEQATALRKESEERHRVEAAMHRAQRLEAIGQLTGGIAHDFNNLLMAVGTTLNLVSKQISPGHPARLLVERAIATTDRGSRLTKQLLVFSETQMIDVRAAPLDSTIAGARDLVGSALGPNIEVVMDLRSEGVWVRTDPDQLQLAILNLALNARDAMPDGGTLHISTSATATEIVNGEYRQCARVRVADTGIGMSPEVAARAVEPFFTTKTQGQGTGLGLAQVYGVMKQSGGELRIESERAKGTTIDLSLLCVEPVFKSAQPSRETIPTFHAARKYAVILLIDDDDEVRAAMAELFRCEGHEVMEANSGQTGLDILKISRPSIAVIDYLMPGLNGVQVALLARDQVPSLPIVFVSGYADTMALEGVSGAKVLRKPVNADELLAVVGEYATA